MRTVINARGGGTASTGHRPIHELLTFIAMLTAVVLGWATLALAEQIPTVPTHNMSNKERNELK